MGNNDIRVSISMIGVQHKCMHKFYLHEINIKFMYFDAEQKVRYCWVLLGHVEVEKNTTYISYDYFKRILWYKFMFYFVFYHLTRFGYLKIYKNIFRCEEILNIMILNTNRFS